MKDHLDLLRRQLKLAQQACQRGLAAQVTPNKGTSYFERLQAAAHNIDDILPFVVGNGITVAQADSLRQQLQQIPWFDYQKQILADQANQVRDQIIAIRNSQGYDRTKFRQLENAAQRAYIFDWRSIGVSSRERRIWERLADSDISPYDSSGWLLRLEKLEAETADM